MTGAGGTLRDPPSGLKGFSGDLSPSLSPKGEQNPLGAAEDKYSNGKGRGREMPLAFTGPL